MLNVVVLVTKKECSYISRISSSLLNAPLVVVTIVIVFLFKRALFVCAYRVYPLTFTFITS